MAFDLKIACLTVICTLCLPVEAQGQIFSDTTRTEAIQEVTVTSNRIANPRSVATSKKADAALRACLIDWCSYFKAIAPRMKNVTEAQRMLKLANELPSLFR